MGCLDAAASDARRFEWFVVLHATARPADAAMVPLSRCAHECTSHGSSTPQVTSQGKPEENVVHLVGPPTFGSRSLPDWIRRPKYFL